MFSAGMTADTLRDCLLNLPPLELLGMTLLQSNPHVGFFPSDVPRETLKTAVVEMIDYGERCQSTAQRLSKLTPVPMTTIDLWEYAL
ncbi:MAG: hypothetical protein AAF125_19735 [Chloroflexota bacterium]